MSKQNPYVSRKPKMLKDFDKTANLVRNSVVARYGSDFADTIHQEARQEYGALIPQIPYIEGIIGSMLNSFLCIAAQEVAAYRAMKKQGKTAGEAWEICHEALRLRMKQFPINQTLATGAYHAFRCLKEEDEKTSENRYTA